eukprot:m.94897 g.94897  ORF g.94897 m.94897 type:complete len:242 (+) comp14743_c2_seq1:323-1048(+)
MSIASPKRSAYGSPIPTMLSLNQTRAQASCLMVNVMPIQSFALERNKNRGRRRPPGTVGFDISSADLKRKLEFEKTEARIDAHGQVPKHEPKKIVSHKLPDYSKVSSKIAQDASPSQQKYGGNVRVKYGVVKKRNLPPLAPPPPDREATYMKRKELLREYTRRLDTKSTSPEKTSPQTRSRAAESEQSNTSWTMQSRARDDSDNSNDADDDAQKYHDDDAEHSDSRYKDHDDAEPVELLDD